MSTKASLFFKRFKPGEVRGCELHIFEETITAPPYRIDFEVELWGDFGNFHLRGILDKESLEILRREGVLK